MNRTQFKALVKVVGECWLRQGSMRGAYGQCNYRDEASRYAHRLGFKLWKGPIPPDKDILHSCDNTLCVRPKHLRAGTKAENQADAVKRGRRVFTPELRRKLSKARKAAWQNGTYEHLRRVS